MKWLVSPLTLVVLLWCTPSFAGQISTYIQGTILKRTKAVIVVQTPKGTYWIKAYRPPSHTTKYSELETGFWVQARHIKRFRPTSFDAKNALKKSSGNAG